MLVHQKTRLSTLGSAVKKSTHRGSVEGFDHRVRRKEHKEQPDEAGSDGILNHFATDDSIFFAKHNATNRHESILAFHQSERAEVRLEILHCIRSQQP